MRYDVAIITVSTNKLDEACLSSVRRLIDATKLSVAFVVVDNGSSKIDAHAFVKKHVPEAIVVLRDKNYGFGRSCNRGAREVDAEYYFFLNPDTDVKDLNVIQRLYDFMRSLPRVGIAAPRIRYMDGRIQETCCRFHAWYTPIVQRVPFIPRAFADKHRGYFLMEDFDHSSRRLVDWVQGSAFMMDGALFHQLNGFDDRFWMYFEDVDLCRRSWQAGRPVYYVPDVELFHAYGKESAKIHGVVRGILQNAKTRMHILSWLKYLLKWKGASL